MCMLNYDAVAKREFVAYPLDDTLYTLGEEEIAFFKSQTGIDDEEELKRHILRLQKEAYEVRQCHCSLKLEGFDPCIPTHL